MTPNVPSTGSTPGTPRVLELLGPSTGGIRRHVGYLRDHLEATGWSVTTAGPEGVLDRLDHVVPVGARTVIEARRRLAALDVDLIHAHGLKAGWIAASLRHGPPVVLSVHNLVLDEAAGRAAVPLRFLEGLLPGRVDRVIAISDGVAARFDTSTPISVIPPAGPPPAPDRTPAQVRAELGVGPDADLVVTAARLHPQKGLDLLLDAADAVRARRPGLQWLVFGEGPDEARLRSEITRRGLDGIVRLEGRRATVDAELAAADVVAITSRWESGPLVLLEALALGRPAVSTRVGLAGGVLPDRQLVDVDDAPAFADAVVSLLADPPDVVATDDAHRPEALAERVADVYREMLP